MEKVENITPYGTEVPKGDQVERMFDSIAPAYDFMNRAMTLGIDKLWRAWAVRRLGQPERILDVATGTSDLALELARKIPAAHITGIDLSEGMLAQGRKKVKAAGLENRITLRAADCLELPFEEAEFDCITVAYGVRNFADIPAGLREMRRVLRPGGRLCIIELSVPTNPMVRPLYKLYTRKVIPSVGRLISKDSRAYSYLPESIAAVPQGPAMTHLMEEAGFQNASYRSLTFGVCTVYSATK